MAVSADKGVFNFIWRIQNFSMCPQKRGEGITSPKFVLDALHGTAWYLALYPKGTPYSSNYVSCFLCRANNTTQPETVTVMFCISHLLTIDSGKGICTEHTFKSNTLHGVAKLIDFEYLSAAGNRLLPNDVFSVLCIIRWAEDSAEVEVDMQEPIAEVIYGREEISTVISESGCPAVQRFDQCMATTLIAVDRSKIKWIIKDFKTQMQTVKKIKTTISTKIRPKLLLLVHCHLSGDWDSEATVRFDIERNNAYYLPMLLKCKISAIDKNGAALEYFEGQNIFGKNNEMWSFPLLKVETIEKSELLNDGSLTLQCEFVYSANF